MYKSQEVNDGHNSLLWLLFQVAISFIPMYILYASLPPLLPFYRSAGIFISIIIFLTSILAYFYANKESMGIVKIIAIYNFTVIVVVFLVYHVSSFLVLTSAYEVEILLRQNMSTAKFMFFAICFIQPIFLPVPEAVTIIAGSSVFGALNAFILGFLGTLLGIIAMFYLSRIGGIKIIRKLVKDDSLEQYHQYVKKNEIFILAVLFIIPVLPDEIISAGAGLSGVSIKRFLIIASISKIITSFVLSYSIELAYVFSFNDLEGILFILGAVLILGVLTILIKNNYLNK